MELNSTNCGIDYTFRKQLTTTIQKQCKNNSVTFSLTLDFKYDNVIQKICNHNIQGAMTGMSNKIVPQFARDKNGKIIPKHLPVNAEVYDIIETNQEIKDHEELTTKELFVMNLVDLMNAYGKSQSDIVNETGLSKSTVSAYYNGDRFPRAEHLEKLAKVFHISPSYLIGETVEDKKVVADMPIEIRTVVNGMLHMNKEQMGELLRYCQFTYRDAFAFSMFGDRDGREILDAKSERE